MKPYRYVAALLLAGAGSVATADSLCGVAKAIASNDAEAQIFFNGQVAIDIVATDESGATPMRSYEMRNGKLKKDKKDAASVLVTKGSWVYVSEGVERSCSLLYDEVAGKKTLYIEELFHKAKHPPRTTTETIDID